jgi:hypothetical protein
MPSVSRAPLSGRYLSFAEREEIAILRARGFRVRESARRMGRSPSTISRELRRNAATCSGGLEYRATTVQWHADRRVRRRSRPSSPLIRRCAGQAPRVTEILREDYGYVGSVDLVKKRLAVLRPRAERPAQRTGYRPGQVARFDWAEMPTRPKIAGRELRGHYAFHATQATTIRDGVVTVSWLV